MTPSGPPNLQAELAGSNPAAEFPQDLQLRVSEALPRDAGRGIVRCDPPYLERLSAQVGDVVELSGDQGLAVARVMPTHPDHRGQGVIQMDSILRHNAAVGLDQKVTVRLATQREARSLTLLPAGPGAAALRKVERRYLAHLLTGVPLMKGNRVRLSPFGTRPREFTVQEATPEGPVVVSASTRVTIKEHPSEGEQVGVSYEDIGGLHREIQRVREMIELPMKYPEIFERLGIDPPRGVLLQGPPGCGKTLIARAVARETEAAFFPVSGPEIIHKFYGESEAHLRQIFEDASKRAPSIVFIDEIDAIAPRREDLGGEKQVELRVVAQLLALLDGLESRGHVIVIAATNLPNILDPALRRPGRFDREISIGVPDRKGRLEILEIYTRGMPLEEDVNLETFAERTHGFVGADLEAFCREAAMHALRRLLPKIDFTQEKVPYSDLLALQVGMQDFAEAFQEVEPSALREVSVEIPNVCWEQVGGLGEAKRSLQEAVDWPLAHPDLVRHLGTRPPRGILLTGPPGTGKTLLAQAVASESGVNFISISGPSLISKFVGDSERGIREVFRKARLAAPCVVFFDELDGLLPRRGAGGSDAGVSERVMTQFLAEFSGVRDLQGVVLLGATNRLDILDPALLRPGRFDVILELPLPDVTARGEILAIHSRGKPMGEDVDLGALAAEPTEGLSGADLEGLMTRASWLALREYLESSAAEGDRPLPRVRRHHLEQALKWLKAQRMEPGRWGEA